MFQTSLLANIKALKLYATHRLLLSTFDNRRGFKTPKLVYLSSFKMNRQQIYRGSSLYVK